MDAEFTEELDAVCDLLTSSAFEYKTQGRERAGQLVQRTDCLDDARVALQRILDVDVSAAQIVLDSWCAKVGEGDVRSAMDLASDGADRLLDPSSDVQRWLGEAVLARASGPARHRDLALRWLSACEAPLRLSAGAQGAIVDAACNPSMPRRTREHAVACIGKIEHWADDAMDAFAGWLVRLPGRFWHDGLIQTSGGLQSRQLAAVDLRRRVDACLLGSSKSCDQRIDQRQLLFVAHPFVPSVKQPLREALGTGKDSVAKGLELIYADTIQTDGTVSCKICRHIRRSMLTLFDLTPECLQEDGKFCDRAKANPNVALELGLAFAYGVPTILVARSGPRPPVDLAGHQIEFFDCYSELREIVPRRVKKMREEAEEWR